jgi:hypothetical protein
VLPVALFLLLALSLFAAFAICRFRQLSLSLLRRRAAGIEPDFRRRG